jgi:hypothetical protein
MKIVEDDIPLHVNEYTKTIENLYITNCKFD